MVQFLKIKKKNAVEKIKVERSAVIDEKKLQIYKSNALYRSYFGSCFKSNVKGYF